MEALSVAANIIAVLQAANTVISVCYDYRAAAKGASWELSKVTEEVRSLRNVLESLEALARRAEDADPSTEARLPTLKKLLCKPDEGPLPMCKADLETLSQKLQSPKWTGPATSKRTAVVQALKWPLKEGETKKMLQNIERYKATLNMALGMDQTAMTLEIQDILQAVQAKTSETSKDLASFNLSFTMAKLDAKLDQWLSAPDPSSNHNEACNKRQATTGEWFVQSTNFARWKEDRNSLLWLHGIPGCGKTILCSTIIENVLHSSHLTPKTAIAYFYFDFRSTEDQHDAMIRSLITQLATQCTNKPNPLESLYSFCGDGKQQPKICKLKQTLQDLVKSFNDTFIILDALDECKKREDLLKDIRQFVQWEFGGLHIAATSRREEDIKQALAPFVKEYQDINIQSELVDSDIRIYVREILRTNQALSRWHNRPKVQDEIEEALTKNAHGMFRWVVCQIDQLQFCLSHTMLQQQLRSLPATLEQTYERILLSIDEDYEPHSKHVLKLLQWLTYSRRNLDLKELAEVVAIDEDECSCFDPERRFPKNEEVLLMCSSLVTATVWKEESLFDCTQAEGCRIKLAHYSVKEYLVSSQILAGAARKYSIQEIKANVCIARDCLWYLLYFKEDIPKPSGSGSAFISEFPLIQYALCHWAEHVRLSSQADTESMTNLAMKLFTSQGNAHAVWGHRITPSFGIYESVKLEPDELPLNYVSQLGLLEVSRRLITMGVEVNAHSRHYTSSYLRHRYPYWPGHDRSDSGHYGNALRVASASGHTEIVKLLLETGADPNAVGHGWEHVSSAIYLASERGYDEIVKLLLDAGADIGLKKSGSHQNALGIAASNGHDSVVTILIKSGQYVNLDFGENLDHEMTALSYASYRGHVKVVKLLLEAGADPKTKDAALRMASRLGRDEVVKILIGAGAGYDPSGPFLCPLLEAASRGRITVMKILLEAGVAFKLEGVSSTINNMYGDWDCDMDVLDLLIATVENHKNNRI